MRLRLGLVLFLLMTLALLLAGCQPRGETDAASADSHEHTGAQYPRRDKAQKDDVVAHLRAIARPLDDPANPYKDQYEQFDYWIYDRVSGKARGNYKVEVMAQIYEIDNPNPGLPEGWAGATCSMDPAGYLLPLWLGMAQDEYQPSQRICDYPCSRGTLGQHLYDPSGGPRPQAELIRVSAPEDSFPPTNAGAVRDLLVAQQYPSIPVWIADSPPLAVLFVPNGEFLFYGDPGMHEATTPLQANAPVLRYNARGELLGRYTGLGENIGDIDWKSIYWPGVKELRARAEEPGNELYEGRGAYTYLMRADAGQGYSPADVREVYDFDGTRVDPQLPYSRDRREMGAFHVWDWRLKEIYGLQLKYGFNGGTD